MHTFFFLSFSFNAGLTALTTHYTQQRKVKMLLRTPDAWISILLTLSTVVAKTPDNVSSRLMIHVSYDSNGHGNVPEKDPKSTRVLFT
jgi:hypothetical protein